MPGSRNCWQKQCWRTRCSSRRLLRSSGILLRREAHLAERRETSDPGASPQCRCDPAGVLRDSARQACRGVGQHRSTQRHGGKAIALEEADLRRRLWHIAVNLIQRAAARPTASCGGKAGPRTTSGCNGSGVTKACSGLRRESEGDHSPPKAQWGVIWPSIPTRSGAWTSSSPPKPMSADLSS